MYRYAEATGPVFDFAFHLLLPPASLHISSALGLVHAHSDLVDFSAGATFTTLLDLDAPCGQWPWHCYTTIARSIVVSIIDRAANPKTAWQYQIDLSIHLGMEAFTVISCNPPCK